MNAYGKVNSNGVFSFFGRLEIIAGVKSRGMSGRVPLLIGERSIRFN
jgi:hypothetical protein